MDFYIFKRVITKKRMTEIIGGPRNPKDLLSGPSQKKLADPCSPASSILGVLSGCGGGEQYGKQRIQDLSLSCSIRGVNGRPDGKRTDYLVLSFLLPSPG